MKTGVKQFANVLETSDFHSRSKDTLANVNKGVAKETGSLSKGGGSLTDYRPKAPKASGKLGSR